MATREEVLQAMNLAPTWRLRDRATGLAAPEPDSPDAQDSVAPSRASGLAGDRAARIARLEWKDFAADVEACVACGLCRTRKRAVPGVGDTQARWMFVGEAPGAEEDQRGEPFVGQAGRLLDSMLAALGMARQRDVYIANVLKCRPPNNRNPEAAEAEACRPYLERQVELVNPRLLIALGKSAASLLLHTDASIASLRGRLHRYQGRSLIVTYHPAYLLRTPADKAKVWEDLVLARRTLAGLEVAPPAR